MWPRGCILIWKLAWAGVPSKLCRVFSRTRFSALAGLRARVSCWLEAAGPPQRPTAAPRRKSPRRSPASEREPPAGEHAETSLRHSRVPADALCRVLLVPVSHAHVEGGGLQGTTGMCFNSEWGLTALRKKSPNGKASRDRAEQRSLELAHDLLRRASSSFRKPS